MFHFHIPKEKKKPREGEGKTMWTPTNLKPLFRTCLRTGWVQLWEGCWGEGQQSAACFPSHAVLFCSGKIFLCILRKGSDRNWAKSKHLWS